MHHRIFAGPDNGTKRRRSTCFRTGASAWASGVRAGLCLLLLLLDAALPRAARCQAQQRFDFTSGDLQGFVAAHEVTGLRPSASGLKIDIGGSDPYIIGPPRNYPAGQPLWLRIRLRSDQAGSGQIFYFSAGPSEKDSVRFDCRAGVWQEIRVPLPPLGPQVRFRFDPPGDGGSCLLAAITVEPRNLYHEPDWPPPDPPAPANAALTVQSGDLKLVLATSRWNDFTVSVGDRQMAIGHSRPYIGILDGAKLRWIDIGHEVHDGRAVRAGGAIVSTSALREPDGATWQVRQTFSPASIQGAIDVKTEVTVDQDRSLLFLPMFVLLPGSGSFGAAKDHGLFAGLEYLDKDEPSSSEADIVGPGSRRQVPDSVKVTLPLMAIQQDGAYVGLAWRPDPAFAPLFDSPDRHFSSGGHLLGLIYPGSDGNNREEGSLLPYDAQTLKAGHTLTLFATIVGGKGTSVVPAVQQFVALNGAPPPPRSGIGLKEYVGLASAGWLNAGLGQEGRYRHALPGTFIPQPAADAAYFLDWLSNQSDQPAMADRLASAAAAALTGIAGPDLDFAAVGHIRYPLASLLYGHEGENAEHMREMARGILDQFTPDGVVLYRPRQTGPDLARSHFARDANGLTAQTLATLLEAAAVTGDAALQTSVLHLLDLQDRYQDGAPRGAQTWEVPLHTPDILASANLVRCYVWGYTLSGDPRYIDRARYWAWTGVPFVYLVSPLTETVQPDTGSLAAPAANREPDPVGLYGTIAVFGATQWVAPNWMGLPVQWCGLVYADSLYRLYRIDPNPLWKRLADGIAVSGVQQTWPRESDRLRQGLLPDSFALRAQTRRDPAINPGTVQAAAVQLFSGAPLYDARGFHKTGRRPIVVHAPGGINGVQDGPDQIVFTVDGWPKRPYYILVSGLSAAPSAEVDGKPAAAPAFRYDAKEGSLVLRLAGKQRVALRIAP